MSRFWLIVGLIAVAAVGTLAHASRVWTELLPEPVIPAAHKGYSTQSVVYHVEEGNGWLGLAHERILRSASSHLATVGYSRMSMRIVLQGEGVDILLAAAKGGRIRELVDKLRVDGVQFLVCRDTLIKRKIAMSDLYGVTAVDLVPQGIAEVADLVKKGYVYLKP